MADINKSVKLQFETNADTVKESVNSLLTTVDKSSAEYAELEIALRAVTEAENNLKLATESLNDTSGKSDAVVQSLTDKYNKAKIELNKNTQSLDKVAQKHINLKNNTERTTSAMSNNLKAVQANGGAMGILNAVTGGVAQTFKDAYEASDLLSGGMGKALTSFKKFSTGAKAALISTGIGALVVAVGLLVAYWDDIKGVVSGVNGEMKRQGEIAGKNVKAEEDKLNTLNNQDNILKQQGKSETEILQIKIKQKKETIQALEAQLIQQEQVKKAQIEASKRNREILEGVLKFISLPITALLKTVDSVGKAFGKDFGLEDKAFGSIAKLVFDEEEVAEEADKAIDETKKKLNELKNSVAGDELAIENIRKEAYDKAKEDTPSKVEEKSTEKERLEKKLDLERKFADDIANLLAKTDQEKLDLDKKRAQAELDALKLTADEKIALQKQLDEKYRILQNELNTKLEEDRIAFLEKFKQKEKEFNNIKTVEEVEALKLANEIKIESERENTLKEAEEKGIKLEGIQQIEDYYTQQRLSNEQEASEATKKIQDLELKAKEDSLSQYGEILGQASTLLGEATVAGKIASVASASISTYLSAQKAYESQLSIETPDAPIRGALAAGVAVASGLANIKKILSVKVPGAGDSSGGGGGVASLPSLSSTAPNVSFVGSSENQIANSIARQQDTQTPLRAYVVSSEVTTQQELDRNMTGLSSL